MVIAVGLDILSPQFDLVKARRASGADLVQYASSEEDRVDKQWISRGNRTHY
jgi:hypothetical protein